jgi:soluble lytic murein transglycosylase
MASMATPLSRNLLTAIGSSASASRVAIASLLLLPSMCMAQELTANQSSDGAYAAANRAGIASAVAEWRALADGPRGTAQAAGFDRIARFLMANPGWPREMQLRQAAEAALGTTGGYVPASAAEFFTRFPPTTAAAHLRHAMALQAAGRRDDALTAARLAWTSGSLTAPDEALVMQMFPGALTSAEHDLRMDRLLWNNATLAAQRQIAWVSPARRAEFDARLAFRTRATGAALRASAAESANPSLTTTNAGYIADKATWLAATGQSFAARALLSAPRRLAAPPLEPEKWMELLLTQARGASREGQHRVAFDIARQIDDALPPGAAILEQSAGVRDEATSLLWLAASAARQHLNRPGDAATLYARYAVSGRSAQVRSRGLYWAGRSAEAAGDRSAANDYLTRAGRDIDQFYGQLALERLGREQPRPEPEAPVQLSQSERQAFENDPLVRATQALGELGAWNDQSLFVRAVASAADTPGERMMAARLADQIGRPDLNVWVGRSARLSGHPDYVPVAFPTVRVPAGLESRWTFIHAISRQESSFDRAAVSHAGARGQMQLMPGTAREQAGRLGLPYDFGRLTTDTEYNMMLGSDYFERMLSYYGGSYPLAVAAYNAGPGNVNRWLAANGDPRTGSIGILDWIEAIPISETRGYVQRVLENAVVYDTINPNRRGEARNLLSRYLGKREPG